MNISTIEEFTGQNPVPIYLGQKYTDKLKLQITLIKNPCVFHDNLYFHEKDCRWILRVLTGAKGYQWLKLITSKPDEDLWYKAKVIGVTYKRISGNVTGIILNMECDSFFAWSKEYNISLQVKSGQHFYVYNNTDDLNNYVYPIVSIISSSAGDLSISNISDNNWISEIKNVQIKEKVLVNNCVGIVSQYY